MGRKKIRAVLFGPQGCGKGTQGQLLADRFDVPIIGAGDMIRQEIAEGTHLGKLIQRYVNEGTLAPDDITNGIMSHRLKMLDLEKGFILDGFPRNVEQAEHVDRLLKVNVAIYIKISDEEAVRRLQGRLQCPSCRHVYHLIESPPAVPGKCSVCGAKLVRRDDDNTDEVIRQRLATFHFITEPMASYYRRRGVLLQVKGEQPIPSLFQELARKMVKLGFSS